MSMTVHIIMKGITDLEILLEALGEMGIKVQKKADVSRKVRGKTVLAIANIEGRRVGFTRNRQGELTMVGDSNWHVMKDRSFHERLLQECAVASVKKRVEELRYQVASVTHQEDGSIKVVARAWG